MMFSDGTLKCALFSGAMFAVLYMVPAQADDTASITVTATIVNRTCTADWTGDPTKTAINIGTIDVSNMTGKGKPGGSQKFTLTLTNCTQDVGTVTVTATGTPDDADTSSFKNTGDATGVAVNIWSGEDYATELVPNASGSSVQFTPVNGTAAMNFNAVLIQDSDTAPTSGSVSVPITLNMHYD